MFSNFKLNRIIIQIIFSIIQFWITFSKINVKIYWWWSFGRFLGLSRCWCRCWSSFFRCLSWCRFFRCLSWCRFFQCLSWCCCHRFLFNDIKMCEIYYLFRGYNECTSFWTIIDTKLITYDFYRELFHSFSLSNEYNNFSFLQVVYYIPFHHMYHNSLRNKPYHF